MASKGFYKGRVKKIEFSFDTDYVKEIAVGNLYKKTIIEPFESPIVRLSGAGVTLSYRGKEYSVEDVEFLEKETQENPKQNI